MALALDRKSFIDILAEGHGDIGGAMQPPPQGVWGMPDEMLKTLPGYGPDIGKNREEARKIMEKAGYGPDKRLAVKVSVRNTPPFRDPAVILIDQLREIYIDAELETVESATWFPKVYRKDYKIGLNLTGLGVDDPDAQFYENYACGSDRNYTGYCNPQIDKLFDQQSMERDQEKRRGLVFEIDKKLQEDGARPILFHNRFATCWQPQLKGLTIMVNSLFNGWRMEDVWLEKKPDTSSGSGGAVTSCRRREAGTRTPFNAARLIPERAPRQRNRLRFQRQHQHLVLRQQTIRRNPPNPNRCNKHSNQKNDRSPQVKPRQWSTKGSSLILPSVI